MVVTKQKVFQMKLILRGEVFIQNNDFQRIKDKFANPRNAASGSLRQKESLPLQAKIPLKFIAYTHTVLKKIWKIINTV